MILSHRSRRVSNLRKKSPDGHCLTGAFLYWNQWAGLFGHKGIESLGFRGHLTLDFPISIHDKIDTENKLFPDTTPAEVLAMFGALPEEVAVLRKSSDKIIRLQQSISIPITKKSMSKTERDKKIVDMYNNGYSIRDIWKESGVRSKSTVYSILNKYKVQLNRTPGRVPGIRK